MTGEEPVKETEEEQKKRKENENLEKDSESKGSVKPGHSKCVSHCS